MVHPRSQERQPLSHCTRTSGSQEKLSQKSCSHQNVERKVMGLIPRGDIAPFPIFNRILLTVYSELVGI